MSDSLEELVVNLTTYKLQLEHVEALLLNDPENDDLLKLKKDLEDMVNLTAELVENAKDKLKPLEALSELKPGTSGGLHGGPPSTKLEWGVGDYCMAPWATDKKVYEATIERINGDFAVVRFIGYDNQETVSLKQLLKLDNSRLSKGVIEKKVHREKLIKEKERRQEKKARWLEKVKTEESIKEDEKKGWQNFHASLSKKFKSRVTQKSIFASPTSATGHVGVGTNGIGGKQPTNFKMPANRWEVSKK